MSISSPVRLVLFDVDGTLVDHAGAAAAAVQQWLMVIGWADAGTIAGAWSQSGTRSRSGIFQHTEHG